MLEAKFFRDYKHSYMILPCSLQQPDKNYQCKLLTSDKIGEILHCSLRYVNGEAFFYYEVGSRVTLENLYHNRQMDACQVRGLLEQIYHIYYRLGDYFMDETALVLLPQFIFYDLSQNQYFGLYYPGYGEEKPYEALMEYLLEHTDSQDEQLTDCIYQMYERMESGCFSLEDALELLEGANVEEEVSKAAEPAPVQAFSESFSREEDSLLYENETFEKRKEYPVKKKKRSLCYLCLAVFSILGIAGIACVYGLYELSQEELLTLLGCGGVMGICLLVSLIGVIRGAAKEVKPKNGKECCEEAVEEEHFYDEELVSLETVLSRDMDTPQIVPVKRAAEKTSGIKPKEVEEEPYGNTVFFDNERTMEYKLYALNKKNKKHIELTKFPYTVGKMTGCVDCVLADASVSRIHARFDKEGDTIQLTDLNSTNGTYRNGLRMQPQETVEIEPGDELRFGNLNYCYR